MEDLPIGWLLGLARHVWLFFKAIFSRKSESTGRLIARFERKERTGLLRTTQTVIEFYSQPKL